VRQRTLQVRSGATFQPSPGEPVFQA